MSSLFLPAKFKKPLRVLGIDLGEAVQKAVNEFHQDYFSDSICPGASCTGANPEGMTFDRPGCKPWDDFDSKDLLAPKGR
jgi:hypothetical protein